MTIDTLMKMARLVLDTNCFVFEQKYYQQIRGGAMGSSFTMTLANIYMSKWEQPLIAHQKGHNELYGRYIDDVFMTSNLPLDQFNALLDEANSKDENIQITRSMGHKVEFLDVSVENNHGRLKTNVYRKQAAEPYIVPFLSDHPRHIHRNTIKGAVYRAIRLCSEVADFNQERLDIELMLLLNRYPPKFVTYHSKQFLQHNNCLSLLEQADNGVYKDLHQRLLDRPTRRERELEEEIYPQEQQKWNKKEIRTYFTFESGPMLRFKRELHALWKKSYLYPGSPMKDVNLKISTRSNRSLNQLLIKKRPCRTLLTDLDTRKSR